MALSLVVSEIFNVEKYRDLEITVRGQSRPLKMSSFDRAHMTYYERPIAYMGLSRTVSEIEGDFSRKLPNFPTPCTLRPR